MITRTFFFCLSQSTELTAASCLADGRQQRNNSDEQDMDHLCGELNASETLGPPLGKSHVQTDQSLGFSFIINECAHRKNHFLSHQLRALLVLFWLMFRCKLMLNSSGSNIVVFSSEIKLGTFLNHYELY